MSDNFEITGEVPPQEVPEQPQEQEQQLPQEQEEGETRTEEPRAEGEAGGAAEEKGPQFGGNELYYVVSLNDLAMAAASVDYGWLGVDPQSLPKEGAQVCFFVIPNKSTLIGYGVLLGSLTNVSELKDYQKRDLPKAWDHVVRLAWIRCAEVQWSAVPAAKDELEAVKDLHADGRVSSLHHIEKGLATELLRAIEASARQRLPGEERAARGTHQNFVRREHNHHHHHGHHHHGHHHHHHGHHHHSPHHSRHHHHHNSYRPRHHHHHHHHGGYHRQHHGGYHHHHHHHHQGHHQYRGGAGGAPPQQQQQHQVAPTVDPSQFPDKESYEKYQAELKEYQQKMEEYNKQMAAYQQSLQQGGGAPPQQGGGGGRPAEAPQGGGNSPREQQEPQSLHEAPNGGGGGGAGGQDGW